MADKVEDLNLPNSIVMRLLKDAVPEGVNISKEARTTISRAGTTFVLYLTSCANNFALKAKRKTLSASDVFEALSDMELYSLIEPLKKAFEAHQLEKSKKESAAPGKSKKKKLSDSAKVSKEVTGEALPPEDISVPSTSAA